MTASPAWRARRSGLPKPPVFPSSKSRCLSAATRAGRPLVPPWPDLVIGCGRNTARPALAIRRASGARTLAAQIQDPRVGRGGFDLLVVPEHDWLRGPRILVTSGA